MDGYIHQIWVIALLYTSAPFPEVWASLGFQRFFLLTPDNLNDNTLLGQGA